ncbi:hypothetical protein HMPREF0454_03707 [Hafnia alvei ATCC 51873]|uniref:Uncharacterized protein n=1 Tax=Hafnia alvei ATCC 51873 TaxID=1002364 RepID=G9YAT1_HAFAL|nr:hypothetical protein HMPREF0454_03707 [Hafnia alvei ATCC 51873]
MSFSVMAVDHAAFLLNSRIYNEIPSDYDLSKRLIRETSKTQCFTLHNICNIWRMFCIVFM